MMIAALQAKAKPSRAQYRMMATRNMTGGEREAAWGTARL